MVYKIFEIFGRLPPKYIYKKGTDLSEEHLDVVVDMFLTTSYYEFTGMQNKLNLPVREFIKQQCVLPQLSIIRVLINNDNHQVVGFYCGAPRYDMDKVWQDITNYFRDERHETDSAYVDFINGIATESTDYVLNNFAVHPLYRNQGFFSDMMNEIVDETKKMGCSRIVLTNWESHHKSFQAYKHFGFQEVGEFTFTIPVFNESLIALEYQI